MGEKAERSGKLDHFGRPICLNQHKRPIYPAALSSFLFEASHLSSFAIGPYASPPHSLRHIARRSEVLARPRHPRRNDVSIIVEPPSPSFFSLSLTVQLEGSLTCCGEELRLLAVLHHLGLDKLSCTMDLKSSRTLPPGPISRSSSRPGRYANIMLVFGTNVDLYKG